MRRLLVRIEDRCENWANCYRMRNRYRNTRSLEGHYRTPRGEHWLTGSAPRSAIPADAHDAIEINSAWQAIPDAFHQFLLGAHYIKLWSPDRCVREARQFADRPHARTEIQDREYDAYIGMAHTLLLAQLEVPAVFRRVRLVERVRIALDLDVWLARDSVTAGDELRLTT